MYIVTFTAHLQRNMVRTPHFSGAGDATANDAIWNHQNFENKSGSGELFLKMKFL